MFSQTEYRSIEQFVVVVFFDIYPVTSLE